MEVKSIATCEETMGNAISNQRGFMDRVYQLIFYLTGDFLFAGGKMFAIIEWLYIRNFDSKIRQKVKYDVGDVVDHENPRVVGRNRRPAHTFLRSFERTEECLSYWSDSNRSDTTLKNVHYLTGEAGKPSDEYSWKFLLVGSPKESPKNWELPSFGTESISSEGESDNWNYISMPGIDI